VNTRSVEFPMTKCLAIFSAAALVCCLSASSALAQDDAAGEAPEPRARTLGILLYPGFELLDACGPAEMFGSLGPLMKIVTVADQAGPVKSTQGVHVVADFAYDDCPHLDLVLVPGGFGTFQAVAKPELMEWVKESAEKAEITTSVCSGSVILAKAGLLDDRPATSNKQYYTLCTKQGGDKVNWVKEARWVDDGNIVTSSGVSAGMDMALHVISRLYGEEAAVRIANGTEYQWHRDADVDPFAKFAQ